MTKMKYIGPAVNSVGFGKLVPGLIREFSGSPKLNPAEWIPVKEQKEKDHEKNHNKGGN